MQTDEIFHIGPREGRVAGVPADIDLQVLARVPAELIEFAYEYSDIALRDPVVRNSVHQHADALGIGRAGAERPKEPAAGEPDEFASSHDLRWTLSLARGCFTQPRWQLLPRPALEPGGARGQAMTAADRDKDTRPASCKGSTPG